MYQIASRCLLLISVFVLIATSPDLPLEQSPPVSSIVCVSEPLSLTLSPENPSHELGLAFENLAEDDSGYDLRFEHTGTYSGQGTAFLIISTLDENGEIMEDQVIETELEASGGEVSLEQEYIGSLDLNRRFLIEWDSSFEYSFDLVVTVDSFLTSEQCEVEWE